MKSRPVSNNLYLSLLLALFSLFSLFGCTACSTSNPKQNKGKSGLDDQDKQVDSKKVIVLFHGLNCPNDLTDLESKLGKDMVGHEIIRLVRNNSTSVSTTQQAEEMYKVLKEQLKQKNLVNPAICLIGDSHGGLVALEMYRLHKDELNIKGIITNHSPLEGAPGIYATKQAVEDFKGALKIIMANSGSDILTQSAGFIEIVDFKDLLVNNIKPVVVQDLTKDSSLLGNIKSTLSNIDIPVLLLAGKVDIKEGISTLLNFALDGNENFALALSFAGIPSIASMINIFHQTLNKLPQNDPKLIQLEENFGAVIGNKENDCFIPYYSQIGENIPQNYKVQRKFSPGYHHFYGITTHKGIYNEILEFIKKAFVDNK